MTTRLLTTHCDLKAGVFLRVKQEYHSALFDDRRSKVHMILMITSDVYILDEISYCLDIMCPIVGRTVTWKRACLQDLIDGITYTHEIIG